MGCPCTELTCTNCDQKPRITEIEKLIKIYHAERVTLWNRSNRLPYEYLEYVISNHLIKVCNFKPKEELSQDIETNLRMTFEDWYNTL